MRQQECTPSRERDGAEAGRQNRGGKAGVETRTRRGSKRRRERKKPDQALVRGEGKRRDPELRAASAQMEEGVRSPASPECRPPRSPRETEPRASQGSKAGPKVGEQRQFPGSQDPEESEWRVSSKTAGITRTVIRKNLGPRTLAREARRTSMEAPAASPASFYFCSVSFLVVTTD